MPAEFFIHLKTRRVHVAGMTSVPNGDWMAQQARNLSMYFAEQGEAKPTHIIRERDTKFTEQFCSILESDGIKFKPIPPRSPNLNPFAERWIQSVIRECLDHFIVFGEAHLRYLIDSYLDWYHCFRPHQRLNNLRIGVDKPPDPVESLNQRARTSNLRSRRRQAGFCNGLAGLVVTSKRNDRGAHSGAREFAT